MPSLFEFNMAERIANIVDDQGNCNHACMAHAPCGLGEFEAQKLKRFDPSSFNKLETIGVTIHSVEIDDFEAVGNAIPALSQIKTYDARNSELLYKHAVAVRLQRSILIANGFPESDETEQVSRIFGNPFYRFD